MATWIIEWLRQVGWRAERDAAGNVVVRVQGRRSSGPLVCLAAHMDEIGMIVRTVREDGRLDVVRSGGLFPWKLGERPVEILGDQETIEGAISMGSGHSTSEMADGGAWSAVRIVTGLTSAQLDLCGVRPGTPIVPARCERGPFLFGSTDDPMVAAWSFDNRLGVTILLQLLERARVERLTPRVPFLVSFTVQEEIGCHGAKILAQRERPEVFIAVDGSPLVPECPVDLDGRPGIRSADRTAAYDARLLQDICALSARAGVELQPVIYETASSDASHAFSVGATPRAACFGYVRASSHGLEVAPLSTFDHLLTATQAVFEGWDDDGPSVPSTD